MIANNLISNIIEGEKNEMEHSSTASAITPLKHFYGQTTASTMVDRAQSYLSQSTMIGTPVEFTGSQVDEFSASFDIFSDVSP